MSGEILAAPFPYFGGKSRAASEVWRAFGRVDNYVEPFCGSAAMLLAAPNPAAVETINDADGFVANFWRAIAAAPDEVAHFVDWPCNETDLMARHLWLVGGAHRLRKSLEADPAYFDAQIAGWWCWGACNWIGSGWCSGEGPWKRVDGVIADVRKLPHLGNVGMGVNRKLPHLGDAGKGVNRQEAQPVYDWMMALHRRLRRVRVACGDWLRVVGESVTTRHGVTAVFLDPPYTAGNMQYAAGGVGGALALEVRLWCETNADNPKLRVVLCGHDGEHDALLEMGWHKRYWKARKGYAVSQKAIANYQGETLWCSPHCMPLQESQMNLMEIAA